MGRSKCVRCLGPRHVCRAEQGQSCWLRGNYGNLRLLSLHNTPFSVLSLSAQTTCGGRDVLILDLQAPFPLPPSFCSPLGSLSHFILSWSPRSPLFVCGLLCGWTLVLSPFGSAAGKGCEVQTPKAEMEEETPPTTAPSPAVVVV